MAKHVAHVLAVLCSMKSVWAEDGDDVRRLLSGRQTFSVKDKEFGAKGDGHDDTSAIQKAFDKLKTSSGSELQFPKGKYKIGPVSFSGLKKVKINFGEADIFMGDKDMWTHRKLDGHTPWFTGEHCDDLEITGGIFHGDRVTWKKKKDGDAQPNSFSLHYMTKLKVHDMEIWKAPASHIGVRYSHGFEVHDITMNVTDEHSDNTEGVMVGDSTDGYIHNVDVYDGDDCLKVHGTSSNVHFEKCTCTGGHGLTIGGKESDMHVQNVKFSHITVSAMSNGARLKMSPWANGYVRNITWEHITMNNVRYPIHLQSDYHSGDKKGDNKFEIGDLYYTDIRATWDEHKLLGSGKGHPGKLAWITCLKNNECKKLHLKDIKIDVGKPEKDKQGNYKYYEGWVCDGGNELAELDNVSPEWPSKCHHHSPSPGPSPGPSPSDRRRRRSCSLEEQISHSSCKEGDTFGCDNGHVWTSGGCRGRFTCDGIPGVECNVLDTDHAECRCGGSPSPSPSPETCDICELDSPHAVCDCNPGGGHRRRRNSNSNGDCQPAGQSGRRRRCPEQKREWDLEWNSEDDETREVFTV